MVVNEKQKELKRTLNEPDGTILALLSAGSPPVISGVLEPCE
jgi:hypothetical protein